MRCTLCGAESTGASCAACGAAMPAGGPPGTPDGRRTVLIGQSGATVQADGSALAVETDPDQTMLPQGALTPGGSAAGRHGMLVPGQAFGSRYRVVRQLGIGGMGAVYQAWDAELGVTVALKTIRPGSDPWVATELEQRFKRELLLAREVTHKNVVRIHDLGEIDGTKYITMSYVDGRSLSALLHERGKLPVPEALGIARQIASGLQAAHEAGVVHRDLKPANIMVDSAGHALILDFGIARLESGFRHETPGAPQAAALAGPPGWMTGATLSGTVVGTLEYMAPEQAKAGEVDHRADIYAFGLILRDLLVGLRPAADPMDDLRERVEKGLPLLRQVDGALPEALESIVTVCTQTDPLARYQTTQQVCAVLDRLDDNGQQLPETRRLTWRMVAAGVVLAAGLTGGAAWLLRPAPPPKAHDPISVLVADFDNRTGEAIFDDTLEPMFNVALEGASFLNAYNRGQARKLASGLPRPSERLDPETARLVAMSKGIPIVVSGSLAREGKGYRITVRAVDARTGDSVASPQAFLNTMDEVLPAIPRLVAPIRKALGDSTPASVQLESAGGAFTAASLETVHQYSLGMQQQFAGDSEQALRSFSKAAELDPGFARAYAGMAGVAIKLGQLHEADNYIKRAMEHVDRMTDRERYRVRGLYYLSAGNWQKCAEEYVELVKRYPGDNVGHNNLAICLAQSRNLTRAVEEIRHDLRLNPNASAAANLSLFSSYLGDFQAAERAARDLLQAYPSFPFGSLVLALAQLGQGQLVQASDSYRGLEKAGALGASFAASGLGDLALYEGRFADAVRAFEQGAAADLAAKNPDAAAEKLTALAYTQLCLGKEKPALAAADKALASSRAVKIRFLVGQIYAEKGAQAKARELAVSLAEEISTEPQAYAKILEGMSALARNDARGAIRTLTEANSVLDTWIGRFELGRAYLDAGAFAEADSEFDRCIGRRGEALALFMDLVPTYGYLPPVFYYQGRVREGLNSAGAADSYRTYMDIRGKAGEDPLLAEVKQRLVR